MIARYVKKPVEVLACQFDGTNYEEIIEFTNGADNPVCQKLDNSLYIHTLEGMMHVSLGDYIIQGVQREFYPCKPGIFWMTYDQTRELFTD